MILQTLGYPVCHQFPERSFHFGNLVMPLCARCSGVYLGFILSLVMLLLMGGDKKRGTKLPKIRYIVILFLFMLFLAGDVVATTWGLYQRNNYFSLLTGLLMGVSLANFILPVFNFTFWQRNDTIPLLDGFKFARLLFAIALVYFGIIFLGNWLIWPAAIGSIAGVIALYISINTLIYLIIFKKENQGRTIRDLLSSSVIAIVMSIVELLALAAFKYQSGS